MPLVLPHSLLENNMAVVYTSIEDVRASTGMTNTTNISDAYITTKIEMAQAVIDGMVGDVYIVPFSSTIPDSIKAICLNLVMAYLYIDQFGQETEGTGIDGEKLEAATMAILEKIQNQQIKIRNATTGLEVTRSEFHNPVSYPNETSTDDGDTGRDFTMNMVM